MTIENETKSLDKPDKSQSKDWIDELMLSVVGMDLLLQISYILWLFEQ